MATYDVYVFCDGTGNNVELRNSTYSSTTNAPGSSSNPISCIQGDSIRFNINLQNGASNCEVDPDYAGTASTYWTYTSSTILSTSSSVTYGLRNDATTGSGARAQVASSGDTALVYLNIATAPITAPTISGTTFLYYDNKPTALWQSNATYAESSFFVRTQINLSNSGFGGNLEYGRNTSSNDVTTNVMWQDPDDEPFDFPSAYPDFGVDQNNANQWNHRANSTRWFWASRDRATAGTFAATGGVTHTLVDPSTITVNDVTNVPLNQSTQTITLNGCSTDSGGTVTGVTHAEVYSISKTNHGTTDIALLTVSGDRIDKINNSPSSSTLNFTIPSADMPAQTLGASETYYVYSLRRREWSGDYLYDKTDTFTITRTSTADDPDIDVTETTAGRECTPGATSFTMTFGSGTSGDEYQLRTYDAGAQTGTIVNSTPATADASGNFSITIGSSFLPASGTADTEWYSLYARRSIANGGSNAWFYCSGTTLVNTLNLTRRPLTPTITISDDDAASANVGIIVTIGDSNTFTADRLVLVQYTGASAGSPDSQVTALRTDYTGAGTYSGDFTQPRNTSGDNYFYRAYLQKLGTTEVPQNELTGSSFSDYDPSNGGNYQAGYIAAVLTVDDPTRTPSGDLASDYTGNVTINITGATVDNTVRVVRTSPSTLDCADTGILTSTSGTVTLQYGVSGHLPPENTTYTYKLRVKRAASKGGTDVYADTNPLRTFSITRLAQDTTPESFVDFTSATNQAKNTVITSNSQTITTITGNVNVSVSGTGSPEVSINGGTFTSSPGTISNNQTIRVRLTSASTDSTTRTATVTIGTVSRDFDVTTSGAGGSGSDTGSGGTANYGIEIYAPNGTTKVLSPGTRYISLMNTPSQVTINGNSSEVILQDMTGLTTSNSDVIFTGTITDGQLGLSVSRESNGFRITNSSATAVAVTPMIIRY